MSQAAVITQSQADRSRVLGFLALSVLILLFVAGCSSTFRNFGYVPSEVDLANVQVGRDTRETVTEKIGSPGTSGVVREDAWYYVQSRVENYAYQAPEVIERQVLAISFSSNGRVRNIERFGLEDGEVIALNRRVTDDNIKGVSFLRQLLGNLGRVDAGSLID
ncbi:MAG: outer membrane protein assembly factor BamE [Dinoroseobacter sp.]|nr:outer membrane protein assembly factor BamE [Dinoroseobacter sp.]